MGWASFLLLELSWIFIFNLWFTVWGKARECSSAKAKESWGGTQSTKTWCIKTKQILPEWSPYNFNLDSLQLCFHKCPLGIGMLPILHLPYKMKVLSVQLQSKKKSAGCFAHSTVRALSIRVVVIVVSVNAFDTQCISEVTDICYPTALVAATLIVTPSSETKR